MVAALLAELSIIAYNASSKLIKYSLSMLSFVPFISTSSSPAIRSNLLRLIKYFWMILYAVKNVNILLSDAMS
jgi:hypothetical protein